MRRTKAEAAETRCAILAATEKLFFEKGVTQSTLDEIASEAGVTRGAIYWHFQSKSDLFLELYDAAQLPRVDMADVEQHDIDGADPLMIVEKMACDWLELLSQDIHRQRLLSILLRTNFTDEFRSVIEKLEQLDEEHTRHIEDIFARAMRSGRLSKNWTPPTARCAFKWMMKGICWEWLLFGQKFDLAQEGSDGVRRLFADFRGLASSR